MSHWSKAFVWGGVIIGTGYLLMRTTIPTEEEFYNKLSPDLKREVDERRASKRDESYKAQVMAVMKDAAERKDPVWEHSKK